MKEEECPSLDECRSVRTLRRREWMPGTGGERGRSWAPAIGELCEACPLAAKAADSGRVDALGEKLPAALLDRLMPSKGRDV